MKNHIVHIDNLKCSGCASTIISGLLGIDGVHDVRVNLEDQSVHVNGNDDVEPETLQKKLTRMGYPPKGTTNTFQKAKSFVSCAIGRVSGSEDPTRSSSDHLN